MTKLTPSNINSSSSIPNGSIIKKVDDDNFAEVTQSDITALGFTPWGGGSIELIESFVIWENISNGTHLALHPSATQTRNWSNLTSQSVSAWSTYNFTVWQALKLYSSTTITKVSFCWSSVNWWWASWWTCWTWWTLNIYNASGTPWAWAVKTWAVLATAPIVNVASTSWWGGGEISSNAFSVTLPAWNYVFERAWYYTASSSSNMTFNILWETPSTYTGNYITPAWSADNTKNMFIRTTSNTSVAMIYKNSLFMPYLWFSTETKTEWQSMLVKTRWTITQTWATSNWELRYAGNTNWAISTTQGTNAVFVWKWVWTNQVQIRWLLDPSSTVYSSTPTQCFSSWWAMITVSWTLPWAGAWSSISFEISDDGVTWYSVMSWTANNFWGDNQKTWTLTIPKNNFFRVTWSWYTINKIRILPM